MIKFFRDVLSGPLYIVVVLISIVLIMAIIGFLMEKKQKQDEEKSKIVHVGNKVEPTIEYKEDISEIPNNDIVEPAVEEKVSKKKNTKE